jgi:hypothetical protein
MKAFTAMTSTPLAAPLTATTTPLARWTRGETRSQPYRYTPSAIDSRKNARPSRLKGMPINGPACSMKVGQSRPSSKLSTVPEIAPTANRIAVPLAQRCARSRYTGSPVR